MLQGILRRDNCPLLILKYLSQDLSAYLAETDDVTRLCISAVDTLADHAVTVALAPQPNSNHEGQQGATLGVAASLPLTPPGGTFPSAIAVTSREESAPWVSSFGSPAQTGRPLLEVPPSPALTSAAEGPARGPQVPSSGSLTTLTHDCPWSGPDRAAAAHVVRVLAAASGLSLHDLSSPIDSCLATSSPSGVYPMAPSVFPASGLATSRRRLSTICSLLRVLHALTKGRPERIAADLINYKYAL